MMNCKEFRNNINEHFDKEVNSPLSKEMQKHMVTCGSCKKVFDSTSRLILNLKPEVTYSSSNSGLKQNILNQINEEENEMRTTQKVKFKLNIWHKRAMAIAASILFMVAVFMVSNRTPFISTAQAAENIMMKSITAMESLRSMFITMDVRSLEKETFDFIGTEYDFIEYKLWKQFLGEKPWRVEKPGRTVVYDGEKQYLYMPELGYALSAQKETGFLEWMKIFLEPKDILESELRFSEKHDANYTLNETDNETILTVHTNALGDFHNNFRKNTSVLESDNSRIYTFDKKTSLLKSFELYINENGQSKKVIDIKNIAYNIPIASSTFKIELPKGVSWLDFKEPGHVNAFTKITSKEAAKRFFTALSEEDYESITKVWSVLQIEDEEKLRDLTSGLGGLEILSIGEAFKSGLYPGEFVPYKIKLTTGEIEEFNLALRNDNPTKTWVVDGGI